jgi:hypothetical protein
MVAVVGLEVTEVMALVVDYITEVVAVEFIIIYRGGSGDSGGHYRIGSGGFV